MAIQEDMRGLRERLTAAEAEAAESSDALRLTKEDAAAELAENNAALAAASAELQELRDVHHDVSHLQHDSCHQSGFFTRAGRVCRLAGRLCDKCLRA